MWVLHLILGTLMAFNGRRIVWALVGIAGFVSALTLATTIWANKNTVWTLIIAIAAGLVGAALAQALGRVAIVAAGFVAGGYGLHALAQSGMFHADSSWLPFIIGGVIGTILISVVFDWAVIGLTAWIGAGLILSGLSLEGGIAWLVFSLVFVFGILAQSGSARSENRTGKNKKEKAE